MSPEFREYERALTPTVNAYLRPVCRTYLRAIAGLADEVLVLSSAGGLLPVDVAADLPAALLLSGPAGGVRAAAEVAAANGFADCVTFDMGGTSTDVCLVRGGLPEPAPGREVAGFPIRLPSLDVHTIGAGGGSIARIDPGGALAVGPRSAGAVPGPACYGRGGDEPTVTDADLVLGRIPADVAFPGIGALDVGAAAAGAVGAPASTPTASSPSSTPPWSARCGASPSSAASTPGAWRSSPSAAPARCTRARSPTPSAWRRSSCRRGPACCRRPGCLAAPVARELVRSWPTPSATSAPRSPAPRRRRRADLVGAGARRRDRPRLPLRGSEPRAHRAVGRRRSHAEHERRNGHVRHGVAVEVVALRARASVASPVSVVGLPPVAGRGGGVGPCVLAEADCTIWVPAPGWRADAAARPAPWCSRRVG